ncbi:kinase-like protein, partial [Punctularia strigosozonata HHB-11173 SS5]|uniref:kinase-like protein n=1 Tax=Punctularia strigosozonata (strain HHB-11173) TaxID=741275 RepID=UPI000441736B
RELSVWQQIMNHPRILPLFGIDYTSVQGLPFLVSPWMHRGTLLHYLSLSDRMKAPIESLLFEIADAVAFIHSRGFVHNDLTASNVLLDHEEHVRLAGFSLADLPGQAHGESMRSPRRLAPELLHPEKYPVEGPTPSFATDVYAFASLCLEVYTLRMPFADFRLDAQALYEVVQGRYPRRPTPEECGGRAIPDAIWALMEACWAAAAARPSMSDVVQLLATSTQQVPVVPAPTLAAPTLPEPTPPTPTG